MKVFGARFTDDSASIEAFDIRLWDVLDDSETRLIDTWSAPRVRIAWMEEYTGERWAEVDILQCGDSRIGLTDRAVRLLGDLFCIDGEILPLDSGWYPTYVFHPLDIEDAIDERRTVVNYRDQAVPLSEVPRRYRRVRRVRSIAFHPERLVGRAIVGAFGFRPWDFFVTEPAMARLQRAGIRGLAFAEVWDDGTAMFPFRTPRSRAPVVAPPRPWSASPGAVLAKVLVDGRSPADPAFTWPLPIHDAPGAWVSVQEPLDPGHSGLHLIAQDPWSRWPVWGMRAFAAEAGPRAVIAHDLLATDTARLTEELPAPAWWDGGVAFVERELPLAHWFEPREPPLPQWRLVVDADPGSYGLAMLDTFEAALGGRRNPRLGARLRSYVPESRWDAARVQWGTAWRRAADATRDVLFTTTNGSLMGSNEDAADLVADLCLLRGVLHDVALPGDVRDAYEAIWTAYRMGYVPRGWVDGTTYVVTRTTRHD